MNVSSASSPVASATTAIAVKQLKALTEAQMEIMKAMAESQAQLSQILQSEGIGLNVNISA